MARIVHCCIDLRGFLRGAKFPSGYRGVFQHDDGRPMTPEEAHDALLDALDAAERERDRLDAALRASCIDALRDKLAARGK